MIQGNEYSVTQLPAGKGREGLRRLLKAIGPSLAPLGSMLRGAGPEAMAEALGKLLENLPSEDLTYFCDLFGETSTVKAPDSNKTPRIKDVFDLHFAGNYWEMTEWLVFCVEVNYRRFFEGGLAKLVASAPGQNEATSSPSA